MKKMNRSYSGILILIALLTALLSGCSYSIGSVFNESSSKIDASYVTLNGEKHKSINLKEGQTLIMEYKATVKKGTLSMNLISPDEETLWEVTLDKGGSDTVEIPAKVTGTYRLNFRGEKTGGGYHIKMQKK